MIHRGVAIGAAVVLLAMGLFSGWAIPSRAGAQPTSTPEIMREKLRNAEHLLQALALSEFAEIEKYGTELDRLAELQSWYVLPTPEYWEHSQDFRRAAQATAEAGRSRQLESAAEAYGSMVRKCVACHEYMRAHRESREPAG